MWTHTHTRLSIYWGLHWARTEPDRGRVSETLKEQLSWCALSAFTFSLDSSCFSMFQARFSPASSVSLSENLTLHEEKQTPPAISSNIPTFQVKSHLWPTTGMLISRLCPDYSRLCGSGATGGQPVTESLCGNMVLKTNVCRTERFLLGPDSIKTLAGLKKVFPPILLILHIYL